MSTSQYDWAKNIPCRNIQIHGFCKFEHKGCSYNHDINAARSANADGGNETQSTVTPSSLIASTDATINTSATETSKSPLLQSITTGTNSLTSLHAAKAPIFRPSIITQKSSDTNLGGVKNITDGNDNSEQLPTANSTSSPSTKKFNLDSPAFTPITLNKFASPSLDHIPTFVPTDPQPETKNLSTLKENEISINTNGNSTPSVSNDSAFNDFSSMSSTLAGLNSFNPVTAPIFTPVQTASNATSDIIHSSYSSQLQPQTGEELFYQKTNLYPVNFLLYAPPPPPHVELNKQPNERTVDDLFIDNKLREYLQLKNEESLKSISNNELDLPSHVGKYHSLYPIDHKFDYNTKSFGYASIVYKCMSNEDGRLYTMRRLQNVPISSSSVLKSVKKWNKVNCANSVKIYEVFTTRAFNDNSLILIYDYYPMSVNLLENHFMSLPGKHPELITEDCLWNYTIQLLNAITEVNKLGLTIGPLDPSKIIISNKGRIRLSAVGIKDILKDVKKANEKVNENERVDGENRQECSDLLNLGNLVLFLAKSTTYLQNTTEDPTEIIMQLKFTNVFKKMLLYLFSEQATIERFQELVAPMILKLTNGLQNSCDNMESTLMSELENARLVRLFAKLDFISERPEMVKDGSWSETGERYPIKLFKDYVFHQVDDFGKPVVDLTHVINCLNKLDAGVDENILLVSPDEMTCLIMSYKELKELTDRSFLKLIGKD